MSKYSSWCPNWKTHCPNYQQKNVCTDTPSPLAKLNSVCDKTEGQNWTVLDCDEATDFFNRFLGPTADEVFLTGLQAIMEICNRFVTCDKPEVEKETNKLKETCSIETSECDTMTCPQFTVSSCMQTHDEEPCRDDNSYKKTKMCICCKCNKPLQEDYIEIQKTANTPKMCICCKCFKSELVKPRETVSRKTSCPNTDLKTKPCKCKPNKEPVPQKTTCSNTEFKKPCKCCKCAKQSKVKVCRCYDCHVPVVCKKEGYFDRLKSIVKCKCDACLKKRRSKSNTRLGFAKGDTCSNIDTRYYRDKSSYYYC
ncbi:uncharacterized protein LOC103312907 isoform X1 [Tribolium castaneum]|uniref:uncharacterized protein LOC103312907 isoform X1 n=1 Tax=Tribolium castaneum TaxID=7070 RepID=UPI0030FED8A1